MSKSQGFSRILSKDNYEEHRTAAKVPKLDFDAVPGTSSANRNNGQFSQDTDQILLQETWELACS